MYVALNDASLQEEYTSLFSREQGLEIFHGFLKSMACLIREGLLDNLFVPLNFRTQCHQYKLAKDYSLQDWIDDKSIDCEYRRLFFKLIDKYSQTFDMSSLCVESKIILSDCINHDLSTLTENEMYHLWSKEKTVSEGVSCLIDYFYDDLSLCCLLSFVYNQKKYAKGVLSTISLIISDDNSESYVYNEFLNLFGCFNDFKRIGELSKDHIVNNISSGADLWENRTKLFPNLVFCENVKKQLDKDSELFHIKAVIKRLNSLQCYFSKEPSKFSFTDLSFNARDESESVKNNPELNKLRTFKIPDGRILPFFYHMDLGGKYGRQGRLYFYPDLRNKVCYIGYLGKHLSTDKYKC